MIDLYSKVRFWQVLDLDMYLFFFYSSVQHAVVMVLAHWGIPVVLEGSVRAVVTMLG